MHRASRTRSRVAFAIVFSGLLVLTSVTSVFAAGSNSPVSSGTTGPAPAGDGATRIYPDPTVMDLHRQAWDHITVSSDGKRLVVYFWMGVEACNGLGRVDVTRHDGQLKIKLWTGTPPHAIGMVCPELAQLYKTVVHLKRPIIGGQPFIGFGVVLRA